MLKRMISILCVMPLLTPITYSTHGYLNFEMAKVDKVNNYNLINEYNNGVNKSIEQYKQSYENNMLNEMSNELAKQQENTRRNIEIKKAKHISVAEKTNKIYYNPYNLREVSNISVEQLNVILKNKKIQCLAPFLVKYEEQYSINCLAVLGIVCEESGFGESARANNSNNLTGYAVYSNLSRGGQFDSFEECVESTFRLLSNEYLNPSGKYFSGYSIWNVNSKYCTTNNWASDINKIINNFNK